MTGRTITTSCSARARLLHRAFPHFSRAGWARHPGCTVRVISRNPSKSGSCHVKSPLAIVKEKFGDKAKLVAAVEKLTGRGPLGLAHEQGQGPRPRLQRQAPPPPRDVHRGEGEVRHAREAHRRDPRAREAREGRGATSSTSPPSRSRACGTSTSRPRSATRPKPARAPKAKASGRQEDRRARQEDAGEGGEARRAAKSAAREEVTARV